MHFVFRKHSWMAALLAAVLVAITALFAVQQQGHAADTTPPIATINSGPGDTSSGSATFTFSANETSTFKCKLQTSAGVIVSGWANCTSPKTYSGLSGGGYIFKVKATDAAGNVSTVAKRSFTVSTTSTPQCSDGVDNDGDGKTDYPNDPGCTGASDNDETDPVVGGAHLVGAGDIADSGSADSATATLIKNRPDASVYTAGDNAYPDGTSSDFSTKYDPTWGAFVGRTYPSPGNHDYHTSGASGYKGYFSGRAASAFSANPTYYAYTLGNWRLYALDSNISMASGSAQYNWLQNDLQSDSHPCELAYWHHPIQSSGEHGPTDTARPIFALLDAQGADVVLNGHDHDYERFPRLNSSGAASSTGVVEIVVGTGGTGLRNFTKSPTPVTIVRNGTTHGIADIDLNSNGWSGKFVPADGTFTDSFSGSCQ